MTDMEKVLHGLNSCGNDYGIPNICEVTECPYRGTGVSCVHNLARDAMTLVSELLKEQPGIVRCKDCKHCFKDDNGHVIVERCELNHESMRSNFFCADGERG